MPTVDHNIAIEIRYDQRQFQNSCASCARRSNGQPRIGIRAGPRHADQDNQPRHVGVYPLADLRGYFLSDEPDDSVTC